MSNDTMTKKELTEWFQGISKSLRTNYILLGAILIIELIPYFS